MKKLLKKILSKPVATLRFIQKPFKQDVLILINRSGRDTLGLFLVYAYLKYVFKKNVKIKPAIYQKYFWIRLYQPQVVVSVNIDCPSTVNSYKFMKESGITCFMSPTEVFPVSNPKDLVSKYKFRDIIDGALLPGDRMKEIYVDNGKISSSQAFTVGFPTFDWASKKLSKCFITKKEFCKMHGIPEARKLILLISSFTMADYNMANWEKECFHWPKSVTKERAYEYKTDSKKAREMAILSFPELLKNNPDWHILVRKHPTEDETVYEKLLDKNSQITICPDDQIYDLVSASDVVVHWNSTVSALAFGLNKPTILIDLGKEFFLNKDDALSQEGNYICANTEQIEKSLKRVFRGEGVTAEQLLARDQFAQRWFMGLDGKASFRTATLIAEFADKNKKNVRADMSILELIRGSINAMKYMFWFWIAHLMKIVLNKQKYFEFIQKMKKYDMFIIEFTRLRYEKAIKKHLLNHD